MKKGRDRWVGQRAMVWCDWTPSEMGARSRDEKDLILKEGTEGVIVSSTHHSFLYFLPDKKVKVHRTYWDGGSFERPAIRLINVKHAEQFLIING